MKSYITAFLLGVLSVLSLSPFDYFLVLPISLALVISLASEKKVQLKESFLIFYFYGFGFYLVGLYWISNAVLVFPHTAWLYPFSLFGIALFVSVWFGLFGIFNVMPISNIFMKTIFFSCGFVVIEWFRCIVTSFHANLLGYAFSSVDNIAQICSIFGIYALSFLVIYLSCSMGFLLVYKNKQAFVNSIICIVIVFICGLWGQWRIKNYNSIIDSSDIKVLLVQPNVTKELPSVQYFQKILNELYFLTLKNYKNENIIIWPESSNNFMVDIESASNNNLFANITGFLVPDTYLILGSNSTNGKDYYNSILAIDKYGRVESYYHKSTLVPFGEYIPFKNIIPIENIVGNIRDFSSGDGIKLTKAGNFGFIPMVCYEAILPNLNFDRKDAKVIINITNDNWYGDSIGPYQHATMSRIKAIEFGLPMARVALKGSSFLVDPTGKIVNSLDMNNKDVISANLPSIMPETLFLKYDLGAKFVVICLGVVVVIFCNIFLRSCFLSKIKKFFHKKRT